MLPVVCAWVMSCSGEATAASSLTAVRAGGPGVRLRFGAPVTLPLFCPQTVCKFGGSVGADSFFGFGFAASSNILGSVNRTAVWSSDSGASFVVLPSTVANEGLAGSVVGPGLTVDAGQGAVRTIGGASMNHTLHPKVAVGHRVSLWNVTSASHAAGSGWWRSAAEPKWAIKRTVVNENVRWLLPFSDICTFSDYSAAPVVLGGVWLKTVRASHIASPATVHPCVRLLVRSVDWLLVVGQVVIKTNCTKPPSGWGDAGGPGNIHLFESSDLGVWRWRSLVAAGNATGGAEEGANENSVAVLDDGSLLVVFRRDGGDGWPSHSHKSFMESRSTDGGFHWSPPKALPADVLSARPQLLKIPNGPLFLTGGRPLLSLWVSSSGSGVEWSQPINLAGEHNKGQTDPSLRFCAAFANGSATWLESTAYNSLVRVADEPATGNARFLVCYDRMGTEAPVAPKECQPERVNTFCMNVTVL